MSSLIKGCGFLTPIYQIVPTVHIKSSRQRSSLAGSKIRDIHYYSLRRRARSFKDTKSFRNNDKAKTDRRSAMLRELYREGVITAPTLASGMTRTQRNAKVICSCVSPPENQKNGSVC